MSKRLETTFAGVPFKNPVALASGTWGNTLTWSGWVGCVPRG